MNKFLSVFAAVMMTTCSAVAPVVAQEEKVPVVWCYGGNLPVDWIDIFGVNSFDNEEHFLKVITEKFGMTLKQVVTDETSVETISNEFISIGSAKYETPDKFIILNESLPAYYRVVAMKGDCLAYSGVLPRQIFDGLNIGS